MIPSTSRTVDGDMPARKPKTFSEVVWHHRDLFADAITFVFLVTLFASLEKATPRKTFIVLATLYEKSFPYKENTVPTWSVFLLAVVLPIVIFTVLKFIYQSSARDLYRLIMAMLIAVMLTACITNCLKVAVGRPRPNFVMRCWPDGKPVLQNETTWGGYAICSTDAATENEHRKSFPSGHSSISAAGLGFLTWWLLGHTQAFSGSGHGWRLFLSLIPAFAAVAVGVTRVTDYWHHVSDVVTGLALGFGISIIVYRQMFPDFFLEESHLPMYSRVKNRQQYNTLSDTLPV